MIFIFRSVASRWRRLPALFVGVLLGAVAVGAEEKAAEVIVPPFRVVGLFGATVEAAQKVKLGLEGIAASQERAVLVPGDLVTAVVSHIDGEKSRQWLVHFVAKALNEKERALHAAEMVLYTSTGREIRFPGELAAVAIRVMGPYRDEARGGKDAKDRWSGTLVNGQFLALGIDRACETDLKIGEHVKKNLAEPLKFSFSFRGMPYPPETIAANRTFAETVGMTAEDERAFAGIYPALMSFYQIVGRTQGLDDILRSVLDVSWWGILKSGGNVSPNIHVFGGTEELAGADWGLAKGVKCYAFRFRLDLNGRPALACQMAVTSPRPPLLTSAGIVGLAAQRPDGKGPHLMIRVVDARCGVAGAGK